MSSQEILAIHREWLNARSQAARAAQENLSASQLARELAEKGKLHPREARRAVFEFQAGQAPGPEIAAFCRAARCRKLWIATLAFLAAAAGLWWYGGLFDRDTHPVWFMPLLGGLIAFNLICWALEPVGNLPLPGCGACGEPRLSGDAQPCPLCGSILLKQALVGQVAIWTVGLAFVGMGVYFLYASHEPSEQRGKALSLGIGYLLLGAVVLLRTRGVLIEKYLHPPYLPILKVELEQDFQRITYNRYLARRVLILLISIGVFTLVVVRMLP